MPAICFSPHRDQPIRRLRCALRSEEHTSELQSHLNLVCRLLLEKKNTRPNTSHTGIPYSVFVLKNKKGAEHGSRLRSQLTSGARAHGRVEDTHTDTLADTCRSIS